MADVAQMNLREPDTFDFDSYQDGGGSGKSFTPPDEGKYIGRIPMLTDENLKWTAAGYRKLEFDFDIIDAAPRADGTQPQVRYASFSAKKYSNREGSQLLDLFRSVGVDARPKSWEEYDAICKQLSGRTFQFQLQWEAYNKDSDENVRGQDNFPPDPNNPGKRLGYVIDQYDGTKRWWANAKIKYTISAIAKK